MGDMQFHELGTAMALLVCGGQELLVGTGGIGESAAPARVPCICPPGKPPTRVMHRAAPGRTALEMLYFDASLHALPHQWRTARGLHLG